MRTPAPRLFRPGTGAAPPALTGRDSQQAVLSRCLGDLVAGVAPPHDVVLLGPRWNGKTALLHWFSTACDTASVDVVALTPQRIPNHGALVDARPRPRRRIAKWLPSKVGVGSVGSAECQLEGMAHKDLARALQERAATDGCAARRNAHMLAGVQQRVDSVEGHGPAGLRMVTAMWLWQATGSPVRSCVDKSFTRAAPGATATSCRVRLSERCGHP